MRYALTLIITIAVGTLVLIYGTERDYAMFFLGLATMGFGVVGTIRL